MHRVSTASRTNSKPSLRCAKPPRKPGKNRLMQADLRDALAIKLLAMADDELILGHRNSEWTGHGPILEEDIAFTNIALDELGHASLWYGLHAELIGTDKETYPDRLV